MTDRELVEMAAKAAGMVIIDNCVTINGMFMVRLQDGHHEYWNPYVDDGDALRLAVGLGLLDGGSDYLTFRTQEILNGHDPFAATRRAIVRTAAEVGRANQTKEEN